MQLVYVALSSPLLYDFYNYSPKHPEFTPLLNEFLQVCLNLHLLFFSFPACLWFHWRILIGVFFFFFNFFIHLIAEHCYLWCIAFLYWDEELTSTEATQEEGSQGKSKLDIHEKQIYSLGCYIFLGFPLKM